MTERSFAIAAIGLALAASPTSAEQTLPPGAEALINRAAEKSASLLMTAIDLANREAKSDKNFVVFLKELKKYGFGAPVAMPPWANVPEHEDPDAPKKELTEEERKEKERKHAEMVEASRKRVGTFEINYFKEIDKNHDTKTDAEEISKAIRDYLIFELNDRLINIDGNKDGKLSLQEYALSVPAQGKVGSDGVDWHQREHFEEEEDKDGSGFIEMEEVIGGYISRIHMRALRCLFMFQLEGYDKDGDGKLSREEFVAIADGADAIYAKIFEEGESLEISNAYARLFWVPAPVLEKLVKRPQGPQ